MDMEMSCPENSLNDQNVIYFSFFLLPENLLKFNLCCFAEDGLLGQWIWIRKMSP